MAPCPHAHLTLSSSSHAKTAGYSRPTPRALSASARDKAGKDQAAQQSRKIEQKDEAAFPAPLVLPGDELAWDPQDEAQSVRDWIDGSHRNPVTRARGTVYVAAVPEAAAEVRDLVEGWARVRGGGDGGDESSGAGVDEVPTPRMQDILAYLRAFYHGLPVKQLASPGLEFVPWDDPAPPPRPRKPTAAAKRQPPPQPRHDFIGLSIGSEAIRIRVRPSKDGLFTGQLNLNDLLDAAIAVLPRDAYALLLCVAHDLYEDEEDDFCCGRAYGGSRVAVVSLARYNPALDGAAGVETEHAWPASHCAAYVEEACREARGRREPVSKKAKMTATAAAKAKARTSAKADSGPDVGGSRDRASPSPMHAAVLAFAALGPPVTPAEWANLWLARFCKTASHELGHCFGIAHCVLYACIMQGTTGLSEDARQPPYLCPVDLNKVLLATGGDGEERDQALLGFCRSFGGDRMFGAFAAWLERRLGEGE